MEDFVAVEEAAAVLTWAYSVLQTADADRPGQLECSAGTNTNLHEVRIHCRWCKLNLYQTGLKFARPPAAVRDSGQWNVASVCFIYCCFSQELNEIRIRVSVPLEFWCLDHLPNLSLCFCKSLCQMALAVATVSFFTFMGCVQLINRQCKDSNSPVIANKARAKFNQIKAIPFRTCYPAILTTDTLELNTMSSFRGI